jgi:hypothetical protein
MSYTIKNVLGYTPEELDAFIISNNDNNIYNSLAEKRYMAIYYLGDLMKISIKDVSKLFDLLNNIPNKSCVKNVKVDYIRPMFNNLKEWTDDSNNTYIGRRGIVFVNKERFPKSDSIWANPFKITNNISREEVISKYRAFIINKIKTENLYDELLELNGSNLGCWCVTATEKNCHGNILIDILTQYLKNGELE